MKRKHFLIVVSVVFAILLIPLIAMQFTDEVNWTALDFIVAGSLLFVTGLAFELTIRKVKKRKNRILLLAVILLVFLLIWVELAVGIF